MTDIKEKRFIRMASNKGIRRCEKLAFYFYFFLSQQIIREFLSTCKMSYRHRLTGGGMQKYPSVKYLELMARGIMPMQTLDKLDSPLPLFFWRVLFIITSVRFVFMIINIFIRLLTDTTGQSLKRTSRHPIWYHQKKTFIFCNSGRIAQPGKDRMNVQIMNESMNEFVGHCFVVGRGSLDCDIFFFNIYCVYYSHTILSPSISYSHTYRQILLQCNRERTIFIKRLLQRLTTTKPLGP